MITPSPKTYTVPAKFVTLDGLSCMCEVPYPPPQDFHRAVRIDMPLRCVPFDGGPVMGEPLAVRTYRYQGHRTEDGLWLHVYNEEHPSELKRLEKELGELRAEVMRLLLHARPSRERDKE